MEIITNIEKVYYFYGGLAALTMGGALAWAVVEDIKCDVRRKKLKIAQYEFQGNEELINKYMRGDIIDTKVV